MGIDVRKLTQGPAFSAKSIAVLKALASGKPMSRTDIEQHTGFDQLSGCIGKLKKCSYLTSQADGRTTVYGLTSKGLRTVGIEPKPLPSSLPARLTNFNTGKTYDPKEFENRGRVGLAIYQ